MSHWVGARAQVHDACCNGVEGVWRRNKNKRNEDMINKMIAGAGGGGEGGRRPVLPQG